MKKISLSILLTISLFVFNAFSQEKITEKEQSNLEKFSAKSGTLIEKKFIDVGSVKSAKIQVLTFTDLISNVKVSGVRFEYETGARYSSTKLAFLDKDEVDGLLKSIALMKSKIFPSAPTTYTEVVFTSRSGFSTGCYYDSGKWTSFLRISRYDKDSMIVLEASDIDALETALTRAKTSL
jgi:hypothetical protein